MTNLLYLPGLEKSGTLTTPET